MAAVAHERRLRSPRPRPGPSSDWRHRSDDRDRRSPCSGLEPLGVDTLTNGRVEGDTDERAAPVSRASDAPRFQRLLPLLAVVGTCIGSLVVFRAELTQVPYLNDSAVHEEMVRVALADIRAGHFPPATWFPYLNLGSPQFLHYQSLAAMLTALLAWAMGVGRAFTLTTWLLVCCWPLCLYGASRIFGLRRGAAAAAAMLSPFVSSATGVGYEQISYLWSGYGLWSQLFAMWALPLAWACSWRAVEERRFVVPAALLVAATAALHFETGYLAFFGIVVFVLVRPADLVRRAGRGLLVAAGAVGLGAWALVPLVAQGKWAAVNQYLQSGPEGVDANSYGARRVLSWLVDGDLFDWHHLVLLTPLVGVGLLASAVAWRRAPGSSASFEPGLARALTLLFVAGLVLFFGRPTLRGLLEALPGSEDLFLRRFLIGAQLAGLLLAGVGAAQLASWMIAGLRHAATRLGTGGTGAVIPRLAVGALALAVLVPSWSFVTTNGAQNASFVSAQSSASRAATQLDALVAVISSRGGGRAFAGDPSDWGANFTVGEVPVFKYLASKNIDEVGFTLRTASLMSDPENQFVETNPADYALFGVRWLLLPATMEPPVPASLVETRGAYSLWEIPENGYLDVVDTRGSVAANSRDLGSFSAALLAGLSSARPVLPTVAYESGRPAPGSLGVGVQPTTAPGSVTRSHVDLAGGTASATVSLTRTAVVLLSASYDPGWQVTVDGRPATTEMVAPALVGVRVERGVHTVRFVYRGFPDYPQLLLLGAVTLLVLVGIEWRRSRRARSDRLG